MSYAPSKGFAPSELARNRKVKLPVELGFPKNMLADIGGIPEPENLRKVLHTWKSDGSQLLEEKEGTLASGREWHRIIKALAAVSGSKNVVAEEKRLSRNQQKAAKQRVKTLIVTRGRRLLSEAIEIDARLTDRFPHEQLVLEALEQAESDVLGNMKLLEVCGYNIDNLVYVLQDNSKTKEAVTQ